MPSDRPLLHTARIAVRWGDMDALGHVNNATYFTYLEQARVESFARLLPTGWEDGDGPILASIRCEFKRLIVYPATVIVRVYGGEPGRTSFPQSYDLTVEGDEGTIYAHAEATHVWVDRNTGAPAPLPAPFRDALTATPA